MAHLAAGARLGLAVEMQHQIGLGEQGGNAQDIVAGKCSFILRDAIQKFAVFYVCVETRSAISESPLILFVEFNARDLNRCVECYIV